MKKFSKIFLPLFLIIVLMISAIGCSWVNTGDPSGPDDSETPPAVTPSYGAEDLPDSIEKSQNIIFNSLTSTEREESNLTLQQAVTMVKRSSVAIKTSSGSGSGTIVDIDDGVNAKNTFYILTCHHVISNANDIVVYVPDLNYRYGEDMRYIFTGKIGGERTAEQAVSLVGGDFRSDVALIKLYVADDSVANTIVKAKIMDKSYSLVEGETIFAVGNPTGVLPGTVTSGVVAYVNRQAAIDEIGTMVLNQISVLINPGSSGGSLFNAYGELVGITNAGNASKMSYYAIPHIISTDPATDKGFINIAKQLVATCSSDNYGYVSGRKASIGFTFSLVSEGSGTAVLVTAITEGSVAERSGLKVGDYIRAIKVGNTTTQINTVSGASQILDALSPGDSYTLKVERNKTFEEITFTIYQEYFRDTGVYPSKS